jgi:LAS superfamily LD-carboxypeptidase LdcB
MNQTHNVYPLRCRGLLPLVVSLIVSSSVVFVAAKIAFAISEIFEEPQPTHITQLTSPPPEQKPGREDDSVLGIPSDEPAATTEESRSEEPANTYADGILPAGVGVFDDEYPGVANLNPALLKAVRAAALDAADYDISFHVTSGWRSPEYQNQLLQEAIVEYGSTAEAARWVATAATSLHVRGDAIDIGNHSAFGWLEQHGASYGLCQIYLNEPWHYELRPEAADQGCPPMYADPTADPRLH